jgi:hypothetical protein
MLITNDPDDPNLPILRDDAIAARMRRLLNEGMLALVAGVGSGAGWLDALAAVQPAGGDVVARAAGVDEARLRPWLAALVAGKLVEYDGARRTYALEPSVARFLDGRQGRAYRSGLAEMVALAARLPRRARVAAEPPPPAELLALDATLTARVERGAPVLVLGAGADALARALAASFPGSRATSAEHGRVPRDARGRFDVALSLDERGRHPGFVARLHGALGDGGVGVLALPALSDSPADDTLHPVGAFLLGARALDARAPAGGAPVLPARLAAAGFEVSALARVPSDPFRDYLVIRKPTGPTR